VTILQALDRYYDRMDARGEVVAPGWADEPVGIVLVLDRDGAPLRTERRWDRSGKKAQKMRVPKWFGRQGTGSTPFFLWDNTAYALGISTKEANKTARDHAAFRALHCDALAGTEDEGLLALRRFVEGWMPERFAEAPFDAKMVEQNIAFRLDGDDGLIHARPDAAALVEALRMAGERRAEVECLVTGRRLPPVRLHPKIKGVDGTAAAEVPLVSFQQDSFQSYGNQQGANAPTSEAAAFRYGAALNRLLDREAATNRLKVADATVAFWADASGAEAEAEKAAAAADSWFAALMVPPSDETEAVEVRDVLEKIRDGRPASALVPGVAAGTRFHVLGLAPNAARLSIRFWLTDSFDAFAARLAAHHADLELSPAPLGWRTPPSVQRLLVRTTALQGKFDNIPPLLAGEVMRAVLSGAPYPRTLLAAAVVRLRAGDAPGSGWHAAVIKACINRSARSQEDTLKVGLDPSNEDPAYQLGRLFCVLESAQRAALGQVNASIADRYYGAASATPARVFGPLLRNLRIHVADARRRGFGGWIEPRVAEIMSHLPPELPKTLRLEDQGRFAVGYYHERGSRTKARDEEAALAAAADGPDATEGGNP
jgi:CRISPR-associated protein Csd1